MILTRIPSVWKKIFLSVPFLLYLGLFALDAALYFIGTVPEVVRIGREGVLLVFIVIFLPFRQHLALFRQRRNEGVLRRLLILAIITFIIFSFTYYYLAIDSSAVAGRLRLFDFAQRFLVRLGVSLVLLFLHLLLFGLAAKLIIYKSKRTTMRNFRLLGIALLVYAAVVAWMGPDAFRVANLDTTSLYSMTYGITILLMIVNGFRISWINYLSRRQKWSAFLLSPLVAVIGYMMAAQIRMSFIAEYSAAWAAIMTSIALFLGIYATISGIALFLNLPTAGVFDERVRAIKSMQLLSQEISHFMEEEKLIELVTRMSAQVTKSDFAWFEVATEDERSFACSSAINLTPRELESCTETLKDNVRRTIVETRHSLLVHEVGETGLTQGMRTWKPEIGSLLAVPLISNKKLFGILYTARKEPFSYNDFDQDMLELFATKAAISFENSRLIDSSLEKERLAQELQIAHEAQLKLLPKIMPHVPGLDVAGESVAAREVGGDFYGVYTHRNQLQVVVGDVSGKGTAAAFYMAEMKGVVESLGSIYTSPKEIIKAANKVLMRSLEKTLFVTLFYASFDRSRQTVTFCRAGHNPLLRLTGEGVVEICRPAGLGIGLDDGPVFDAVLEEATVSCLPGDYFVFYTDGVIEARDARSREFEETKLLEIMQKNKFDSAASLKSYILRSLREHIGQSNVHDDYTLVVVGVRETIAPDARKAQQTPEVAVLG